MALHVEQDALKQYLEEYAGHELQQVPDAHQQRCLNGMQAALKVETPQQGRGR